MTTTLDPLTTPARATRAGRLLPVAAVGYTAAWLAALAVPVASIALDAPAREVFAAVSEGEAALALRALLAHGVAAVLLAVVAVRLGGAAARAGAARAAGVLRAAGLAAATLSLVQLALELVVAGPVAAGGDAATVDTLLDTVNRVDGAKMVALAVLVGAGAAVPVLGRRLRALSRAGAAALVVSAAGYGLLLPALAPAAYLSLPLLLVWVTGAGLAVARAARS
jgi:hypothetical protein